MAFLTLPPFLTLSNFTLTGCGVGLVWFGLIVCVYVLYSTYNACQCVGFCMEYLYDAVHTCMCVYLRTECTCRVHITLPDTGLPRLTFSYRTVPVCDALTANDLPSIIGNYYIVSMLSSAASSPVASGTLLETSVVRSYKERNMPGPC